MFRIDGLRIIKEKESESELILSKPQTDLVSGVNNSDNGCT